MDIQFIKKDAFGPEYVIFVYDSKIGMEGILIIDNIAQGPGKGGGRPLPGGWPDGKKYRSRTKWR